MTSTMWELYWATRLIYMHDVFGNMFAVTCFVGLVVGFILVMSELCGEPHWMIRTLAVIVTFVWALSGLINVFTPTKEEAAFIVAGGAVVAAAQSDAGQRIASKSVAVLEGSLDTILGAEAVKKAKLDLEKKVVDAAKDVTGTK